MITETMWSAFDLMIERINADPEYCWGDVVDLFDDTMQNKIP